MSTQDPKDGFDLIEYPCDFPFKAMCRAQPQGAPSAAELVTRTALEQIDSQDLLESHVNQSRTGKFESVTLLIRLQSRQQLESVYQAIAASPVVVMTL